MLCRIFKFILLFCFFNGISQAAPAFKEKNSHSFYVEQLSNSKDLGFQDIKSKYEAYILKNPNNITAKIELCKFIGNSYWDEYEDYNLKYEETEECIAGLYANYNQNLEVLIYRAENLYGEDKQKVLLEAEKLIRQEGDWPKEETTKLFTMLGDSYQDSKDKSLKYYKKAKKQNDSIDLSLSIAQLYYEQGDEELSKKELLSGLKKDTLLWVLNQKADLLLKLKESEKAMELYSIIAEKDTTYINNKEMALAMTNIGEFDSARTFLVKDTISEWNRVEALQSLFNFDLKNSPAKTALKTYRRLQKLEPYDDVLGVKRYKIFLKSPFLNWHFSEFLHLFLFGLTIFVLLVFPYVWILPVYNVGLKLDRKYKIFATKVDFSWDLKDFWIISFLYLLVQYAMTIVFYYEDTINYFFDIGSMYVEEESNIDLANGILFFVLGMALSTLLLIKKKQVFDILNSNWSFKKIIVLSFGFVFFNMVLLRFLSSFIPLEETDVTGILLSAKEEIKATLDIYGFGVTVLLVGFIGPIYEEIIFRGIILGSVEKKIGFVFANLFQAALFALIHFDIKLFLFYFVFGLVTGHLVSKTNGLLTGIIYHIVNNTLVVVALYYALK